MTVGNWTKLATILVVDLGTIYLASLGLLDSQAVVALLAASLGYVFGNGHGVIEARRRDSA